MLPTAFFNRSMLANLNRIVRHSRGCGLWVRRHGSLQTAIPPLSHCHMHGLRTFGTKRRRSPRQPIKVTPDASTFLQSLVASKESVEGIRIGYKQSKDSLAMVYSFEFMGKPEVEEAENRRPPDEKLALENCSVYIDPPALMKVMGATIDVDFETLQLKLLDTETGFPLEP